MTDLEDKEQREYFTGQKEVRPARSCGGLQQGKAGDGRRRPVSVVA